MPTFRLATFNCGIGSVGTLSVKNSTITHNFAFFDGGGIYDYYGTPLTLINSLVTDNTRNDIAP